MNAPPGSTKDVDFNAAVHPLDFVENTPPQHNWTTVSTGLGILPSPKVYLKYDDHMSDEDIVGHL